MGDHELLKEVIKEANESTKEEMKKPMYTYTKNRDIR